MSVWKRLQRVGKRASKFKFTASYQELSITFTNKWYAQSCVGHLFRTANSTLNLTLYGLWVSHRSTPLGLEFRVRVRVGTADCSVLC